MTRWAVVNDAPGLADVHVTSWQHAYRGVLPDEFLDSLSRERRERWWRRFIADGAQVHVVGDDRVVGFCHAGMSDEAGWGEVFAIYVHPRHWGLGLGRELLTAGQKTITEIGFSLALLWVLKDNRRGRSFYERQGWELGKPFRVEEIGGTQVTEVRYELDLRGGV
jgi:GNAT superfamily N-acetyltransferase